MRQISTADRGNQYNKPWPKLVYAFSNINCDTQSDEKCFWKCLQARDRAVNFDRLYQELWGYANYHLGVKLSLHLACALHCRHGFHTPDRAVLGEWVWWWLPERCASQVGQSDFGRGKKKAWWAGSSTFPSASQHSNAWLREFVQYPGPSSWSLAASFLCAAPFALSGNAQHPWRKKSSFPAS